MGLADDRKLENATRLRLPQTCVQSRGSSLPLSSKLSLVSQSPGREGRGLNIIHLPPENDGLAECNTVDHSSQILNDNVGIAAFHNERSFGDVSTVKALRNNYKESSKFLRFLGCDLSDHQEDEVVNVVLGDHGLCWYDPERHQGFPYDGPLSLFRKVTFSYNGPLVAPDSASIKDRIETPVRSEHLMQFRCGKMNASHCFKDYVASPITIVAGICLFNASILDDVRSLNCSYIQNHEQAVRRLAEHPTLHATETIRRLSQAITDMIPKLKSSFLDMAKINPSSTSATPVLVKLDVARLAYYDVARNMLISQRWDFSTAKIWLDIVDCQHDAILNDFSCAIVEALKCRGIDLSSIEIFASSCSQKAEKAFKSRIHNEELPDVDHCLTGLLNDSANVWSKFLDLARISEERRKDLTMKELTRLTYAYEVIEPLLNHERSVKQRLVIMVDCPFEWRIFDTASKALDRYNKAHSDARHLLIGAFPFPRILSSPCKDLFYYDCRREYCVKVDGKEDVNVDQATTHAKIRLSMTELVELSSRLSSTS